MNFIRVLPCDTQDFPATAKIFEYGKDFTIRKPNTNYTYYHVPVKRLHGITIINIIS